MIHDEGAPCCHVGDVPWVCVGMAGLTCANWFLNTQPVCCPTQPQSPISLTLGQVWMLKPAIIHTHSTACKDKSMSHLVVTGCPSFDLHDYIVVCCILRHTAHPFRGCGKLWIPTGQVGSCMHVLFSASESWRIITHLHTHTHTQPLSLWFRSHAVRVQFQACYEMDNMSLSPRLIHRVHFGNQPLRWGKQLRWAEYANRQLLMAEYGLFSITSIAATNPYSCLLSAKIKRRHFSLYEHITLSTQMCGADK